MVKIFHIELIYNIVAISNVTMLVDDSYNIAFVRLMLCELYHNIE